MPYILNSAYLVVQMHQKNKLTVDHVKKIVRTHRKISALRNVNTFAAAAALIDEDKIPVDWAFITSEEVDKSRSVENLLRQYIKEGIISPADVPKSPHSRGSLSSLSTRSPTPPPARPLSAMSGVEDHQSDTDMADSVVSVTNTVDPAATVAVNPDNTVNPADTLMPDVPPGTDSSAANPIGPLGVVTHGPITPAVPTVPNVIPVRCASTTSWKGTSAQFDPEIVWHLIAFDPICDTRKNHLKILTLNMGVSPEYDVILYRHNKLELELIEDSPGPVGLNNPGLLITRHPIPTSARTWSVNARDAVTQSLMTGTHSISGSKTFSVYWRLPGFHMMEEFGPLMIYHANSDTAQWTVAHNYLLPVLGPPEALRVFLIVRLGNDHSLPHAEHALFRRRIGQQPLPVAEGSDSENGTEEPPAYTRHPAGGLHLSTRPTVPIIPIDPVVAPATFASGALGAPVARVPPTKGSIDGGEDGDNDNDADSQDGGLDEDVAREIKHLTVAWLLQEFSNRSVVQEIRLNSDPRALRVKRKTTQLVQWVTEVHDVCTKYKRVPITEQTGMAGDTPITKTNIASLFLRRPQWIKHALDAYEIITKHEDHPKVKALLRSGRIFGMDTFVKALANEIK
ncbi:hypothetical protein C8F04DRAFT_1253788 [Mycena alexandri]|uniref:Uncharacterized protein n=1 Tax=Mycena alexandri TaxID=1745969 RepID=A0AAD6T7J1_9AGAR|nr:hypothetical protein C8F04DRAFT_1253788 [Mycena alexandri]